MRYGKRMNVGSIVLVGIALGLVVVATSGRSGPAIAHADPADDAAALRALVGRFLTVPGSGSTSQQQAADLLPGQMPSDLPLALPQPPNSRVVGSVVRRRGQDAVLWDVILDAPGTPADILQVYGQQLAALGWTKPPVGPFGGGFQAAAPNDTAATFCQKIGAAPFLTVTAAPEASGQADVRVHIDATGPGPCFIPTAPGPPPLPESGRLPALAPPAGVQVQPNGSGSGNNRFTSEATALTDKRAADLEAFYAQQVQAAGWTRVAGGGDGPYAWSAWTLPGGDGYQGLLTVLEAPGQNRRELRVQAEGLATQPGPTLPGPVPTATPAPPIATRSAPAAVSGPPPTPLPFPSVGPVSTIPPQDYAPTVAPSMGPYTPTPVVLPIAPPGPTATPAP
ncbi:MAG: hypothetical protein ACR2M3_13255 [Thermomicrobiales bacterium]